MTDFQERVRPINERLLASKTSLQETLNKCVDVLSNGEAASDHRQEALRNIHSAMVTHFNFVESIIAEDELEGANHNAHWRTYRAETALNALDALANAHEVIGLYSAELGLDSQMWRPSRTAYAGLQRLAAEEFPNEVAVLRAHFVALGLPVTGFDKPVARSAPRTSENAVVEFGSHGISKVSGVSSENAAQVAMGVVSRGKDGFSAPASSTTAAGVLAAASPSSEVKDGWFKRQWSKLRDSPADLAIRVAGSLLAALIVAALTYWGWWVPHHN